MSGLYRDKAIIQNRAAVNGVLHPLRDEKIFNPISLYHGDEKGKQRC
jgi:hypothetical protein